MSQTERRVLLAIASLGEDATIEHLAAVTAMEPDQVMTTLSALTDGGLIGPPSAVVRLTAKATADLTATTREWTQARTRTAEVLHRSGAPTASVVFQLLQVPSVRQSWALDALRTAADEYREAGDQRSAATVLRRTLDERPTASIRRDVLLDLAQVEAQFDTEAAIATYRDVLPLVDSGHRSRYRLRLARLLASANRVGEAVAEADAAVGEANAPSDRRRAEMTYIAIARQTLDSRPLGRERLRRLASEVDATMTDPASRAVLAELGYEEALAGTVDHRDVVNTLVAAFGGDSLEGVHDLLPAARYVGLLALWWCGEHRLVERAADAVLARSRRRGAEAGYVASHQLLAHVYWSRGQLAEAVDAADVVLGAADAGVHAIIPGASGLKAAALATMGRIDDAYRALALPAGEDQWVGSASFQGYLLWQSIVCAAAGDHEAALRTAERCGTLASVMGTSNPAVLRWRTIAAEAALHLDRHEPAVLLIHDALQLSRTFGAPSPLAEALRLAARTRVEGDAMTLLCEAEGLLERTPERVEKARLDLDLARAHAACGDGVAAATAANRALELARQTGAALLEAEASRTLDELSSIGLPVTPPPLAVSVPALDIRALGGFTVVDGDGCDHTPGGVPGRAVRIVVAAGRALHADELADRLWEQQLSPTQVRARLRNVVARSRTPVFTILVRDGDRVSLDPRIVVDADRFEKATEAAGAKVRAGEPDALDAAVAATLFYGGDLLPTDPYADWSTPRREQLRNRYLRTSDLAAGLAAEAGLVDLAVDLLESAIRHDTYDLERYERAATLLERAGRPSQARAMRERAAGAGRRLGL